MAGGVACGVKEKLGSSYMVLLTQDPVNKKTRKRGRHISFHPPLENTPTHRPIVSFCAPNSRLRTSLSPTYCIHLHPDCIHTPFDFLASLCCSLGIIPLYMPSTESP